MDFRLPPCWASESQVFLLLLLSLSLCRLTLIVFSNWLLLVDEEAIEFCIQLLY